MLQNIKTRCAIAFGANLSSQFGHPKETFLHTIQTIACQLVEVARVSPLYQTPSFPAGSGPDYVNAVFTIVTSLSAQEVLERLHQIEQSAGRVRDQRWGSRVADLDLLVYGDQVFPDVATVRSWLDLPLDRQMQEAPQQLILPHPRIQDRGFVLVPLADVWPDWRHPILGQTVQQMCDALPAAEKAVIQPISA